MRAREPDATGYVERDGVRVAWRAYGDEPSDADVPAVLFLPSWCIVPSEVWKLQVPFLARNTRVVTFDPRGNGLSDRPGDLAAYELEEEVRDALDVMDAAGVRRVVLVALSRGNETALALAADHGDRVAGWVALAPSIPGLGEQTPERAAAFARWDDDTGVDEGWLRYNRWSWLRDHPGFVDFFVHELVPERHSTKLLEDLVGWGLGTDGETLVRSELARDRLAPFAVAARCALVDCPVVVLHGLDDHVIPLEHGARLAGLTGGRLIAFEGSGHVPNGRDPVSVNHAIADLAGDVGAGETTPRRDGPPVACVRLSTRRDAPPPLADGRRIGRATAYGDGPPGVVALRPAEPLAAEVWATQLAGIARHLPLLVMGDDVTEPAVLLRAMTGAGVTDAMLVAPPGAGDLAAAAAGLRECVTAVLRVEAPEALARQPGVLECFAHRLPGDFVSSSVLRAIACVTTAEVGERVPIVAVVDDNDQPLDGPVDVLVTVEGGVSADLTVRPTRRHRERRLLYISSPIGLGHVRRDLAIVEALRRQVPDLQVDWLSQSPVTEFLERSGEQVHPASTWLASESGHIESEAGEHDLHAFQAIRRMDEILVNNFHVFDDLVREQEYDAWVGDEAWDLDYFLHENPRLKRAPFVWMTDFVGWVPMPDGGEHEAYLAADYNAEMVEHVGRYPGLRDRSVFVGDPDDIVAGALGPGLPGIREWTEQHYDFSGYVMGPRPDAADRVALRSRLGYGTDETVGVVSVGGSGVGGPLIRRVVEAYDACRARVPSLRFHVTTGPRLDPETVKAPDGVSVHGFLPDLDLHHAACDVALVQGGLSTTMELTATDRPFLYFPLRHHFEQQFHVRHRLERHGAGRAMDYDTADPDTIADAIADELARTRDYLAVPEDGAERAAELVAELL
jgi:pimeloyl-ACP methyl ester carboxylesterase/predicted glycosyltransferase